MPYLLTVKFTHFNFVQSTELFFYVRGLRYINISALLTLFRQARSSVQNANSPFLAQSQLTVVGFMDEDGTDLCVV